MNRSLASALLLVAVVATGGGLAVWKHGAIQQANASSAAMPEPMESVTAAVAQQRSHRQTLSSIGTVLARRSVTLRNELPGTVSEVALRPGEVVDAGAVLIALDTSVERAELEAQKAQAELARTTLERLRKLREVNATSQQEVDRARAEREVALANIARTRALIERKTIRAPFRAQVGMADVHPGQYLNEGSMLTTLQGVDEALHVDFTVPQDVAVALQVGDELKVFAGHGGTPVPAKVLALDARVDRDTRNTAVRARIARTDASPAPGSSVRVAVATGAAQPAVAIPASALRKGPAGDHVFVLAEDEEGRTRADLRTVEVAALLGDEVLIRSGLEPTERVAASGSFKLRDAMLVAVLDAPAPQARLLAGD
ncbi:MAG TPA: efflux RND transporter periplasmic adaptor subunit [Burkholderiaceae bacterium]|nr:efflux RND transporter periplasmic adaptor subunit [Burkholderiaceae bacterium]